MTESKGGGVIMAAWFYLLQLKSGALYCGATENLEQRYTDHINGRACQTTILDIPVSLAFSEQFTTFAEARARETQVKKWSRAKKEALISGDMARLKQLARSRENS